MTTYYSGKMWRGKYDETNFAGGKEGAAYAEIEPALADLKAMNYTFNETQELPVAEYNQEAMEAGGQNASTKQTFTTDKTILPGKMVQVVQNADWLEKAIGAGNGSDDGLVPQNSWCEVNCDGKRVKAAYGCYTKTYTLDVPKPKDLPKETVEYDAYNAKTVGTPTNFATAVAWDTTAAKKHSDFSVIIDAAYQVVDVGGAKTITTDTGLAATTVYSFKINVAAGGELEYSITTGATVLYSEVIALMNAELTAVDAVFTLVGGNLRCIGATSIALAAGETGTNLFATLDDYIDIDTAVAGKAQLEDFESLKLTITNEYNEKQGGEELHKYPRLTKQSWEVEISAYTFSASLEDLETSAAHLIAIMLIGGWGKNLTLTEMKIKPESVNIKEIPEKGMKMYSATYEIGGASTAIVV